jgi:hypothetical protein
VNATEVAWMGPKMKPLAYAILICAALALPLLGTATAQPPADPTPIAARCLPVGWSTNPPDAWVNQDCVHSGGA